jgi:hypothetical protein
MFDAIVLVCAINSTYGIQLNSCISLNDQWGPYYTEENCNIRATQMVDDIINSELNPFFFEYYDANGVTAESIYAEGFCEDVI